MTQTPRRGFVVGIAAAMVAAALAEATEPASAARAVVASPTDETVANLIQDPVSLTFKSLTTTIDSKLATAQGQDPADFGASGTVDSSPAFVAAAASTLIRLQPGATYRITTPATLPPGTILEGNGAYIQLLAQGQLRLNENCVVRNVNFTNGNLANLIGGERFLTVQGPRVHIEKCSFNGSDYRYGIVIEIAGGGSCDDVTIQSNSFLRTSYGVLKQGGPPLTPTTAHNLKILFNRFLSIRRGDAIELNSGADFGNIVEGNHIRDVTSNGNANMGIGIGVAGLTPYTDQDENHCFRQFRIVNNFVFDCERTGIHSERSARFEISGNHVEQTSDIYAGKGQGIALWGAKRGVVEHNFVAGFQRGIQDDVGYLSGSYIISSTMNAIVNNQVSRCTTAGIRTCVSGQGMTSIVRNNTVSDCPVGINVNGASNFFLSANLMVGCPTPFLVDANPPARTAIAAKTRTMRFYNNEGHMLDGTAPLNKIVNKAGTAITGAGNSFPLP